MPRLIFRLLPSLVALVGAFTVSAVVIALAGSDPIVAFGALLSGAFGSADGLSEVGVKACPLLLAGLAVARSPGFQGAWRVRGAAAGNVRYLAIRSIHPFMLPTPAIAVTTRLREPAEQRRQELAMRVALAPLLTDFRGFASQELLQNCERACELCGAVGTPEPLFQIVYALCHVYVARGDMARVPAALEELSGLAHGLGTPEHELLADSVLLRGAFHQARCTEVPDCGRPARTVPARPCLSATTGRRDGPGHRYQRSLRLGALVPRTSGPCAGDHEG